MAKEELTPAQLEKYLATLNLILGLLGNISLGDAKTWAETKLNAINLRNEGHEKPATIVDGIESEIEREGRSDY